MWMDSCWLTRLSELRKLPKKEFSDAYTLTPSAIPRRHVSRMEEVLSPALTVQCHTVQFSSIWWYSSQWVFWSRALSLAVPFLRKRAIYPAVPVDTLPLRRAQMGPLAPTSVFRSGYVQKERAVRWVNVITFQAQSIPFQGCYVSRTCTWKWQC